MQRLGLAILVWLFVISSFTDASPVDRQWYHSDTPPPGLKPGDVYHRVFVTSFNTFISNDLSFPPSVGQFGGLLNADWNVSLAAMQSGLVSNWNGLDITYKAILSTSTVNARDRLDIQGPIYNLGNELVATGAADLWDGSIANAIRYTEFGSEITSFVPVWAGTTSAGTRTYSDAGNWTDKHLSATLGNPLASNQTWIALASGGGAGYSARLYGISGPITVVPEPSSWLLASVGLAVLAVARCLRRGRGVVVLLVLAVSIPSAAHAAFTYSDTPPPGLKPGDVYHRVFVTSFDTFINNNTNFPPDFGEFGGLLNADWNVTFAAALSGLVTNWTPLEITYRAILSDSNITARDRLNIQGPIYNLGDELVATGADDLWDGSLVNAIRYDESGVAVAEGTRVWTGTLASGSTALECIDWLDSSFQGLTGNPLSATGSWAVSISQGCNRGARLYGISGPITVVPEPSSWLLTALGLAAIAMVRFGRRLWRPFGHSRGPLGLPH